MQNEFTYQRENVTGGLETYEWDRVWWEQAPDREKTRVLYIGDSISCGIRPVANQVSNGKMLFDSFGTSKALDNPYFPQSIRLFAQQEGHRELILFNNGLHGWHLDASAYQACYHQMLRFLKNEFPGTPIAVVLTTSVANTDRDDIVVTRNRIAEALAGEMGLPVIDLYAESHGKANFLCPDGVHFQEGGYRQLAEVLVQSAEAILRNHA